MDRIEKQVIEALIAQFNQDGERGPREVVRRLAAHGVKAAPLLADAAETSQLAHVRSWSFLALAEVAGQDAFPHLLRGLCDDQMSVRLRAIQAIVTLRHPEAAKHIVPLLRDPSGGVRVNAVDALVKLRAAGLAEELLPLAADEKWYVRQHAARDGRVAAKGGIPFTQVPTTGSGGRFLFGPRTPLTIAV